MAQRLREHAPLLQRAGMRRTGIESHLPYTLGHSQLPLTPAPGAADASALQRHWSMCADTHMCT